jgi:hypothetical protein
MLSMEDKILWAAANSYRKNGHGGRFLCCILVHATFKMSYGHDKQTAITKHSHSCTRKLCFLLHKQGDEPNAATYHYYRIVV